MKRILICLTLLFLFIVGCEAPSMEDEVIKAVENNTEWELEFKPGTKMNERTFCKMAMLPYNLEVRKGDFKFVNENGKDNSISIEWEILSENLTFKKITKKERQDKKNRVQAYIQPKMSGSLTYFYDDNTTLVAEIDYTKNLDSIKLKAIFTYKEVKYEKIYECDSIPSYRDSFMYNKEYSNSGLAEGCYSKKFSSTITIGSKQHTTSYFIKYDFVNLTVRYTANGYRDYDITYHGKTQTITFEDYVLDFNGEPTYITGYDSVMIEIALEDLYWSMKLFDEFIYLFEDHSNLSPLYGTNYDNYLSLITSTRPQ